MMHTAAVVTCSDRSAAGEREDRSGPALVAMLRGAGFRIGDPIVVPDDRTTIAATLRRLADGDVALVVTTGGTGFSPRDITPEATRDVADRLAPGLGEAMRAAGRASTPKADLSRGIVAVLGTTIVVNTPGSTAGATESLAAIIDLLPHALGLLRETPEGDHG